MALRRLFEREYQDHRLGGAAVARRALGAHGELGRLEAHLDGVD